MTHTQTHRPQTHWRSPAHSRTLHSPQTLADRQKTPKGFTQREIQQLVAEMLG